MHANSAKISDTTEASRWDLVMTRVFNAPRELVFQVWTDPKHLAQWWGPDGFTNPVCEIDLRVGGALRIHMRAPDGKVYPMKGVFEEITPPERLVFVSSALDENGKSMFDILNTVIFAEQKGKTALTLQARVLTTTAQAPQYLKGMEAGWTQTLDRLGKHLDSITVPGKPRSGDPRAIRFKRGYSMRPCDDRGATSRKFAYREIVAPERIVFVASSSNENGDPV